MTYKFLPLFRQCKLFNVEFGYFQGIIRNDYYSILSTDKHYLLSVLFSPFRRRRSPASAFDKQCPQFSERGSIINEYCYRVGCQPE